MRCIGPALVALSLALAGCSDDGMDGPDTGVGDASTDAGTDATPPDLEGLSLDVAEPEPPLIPTLPSLSPCPTGAAPVDIGDGFAVCEPLPAGTPDTCPAGQARFFRRGCADVGTTCPSGAFPATVPASTVFVSASASAGGDGSRAAPYDTIAEAVSAASPGTTVLVGAGEYAPGVAVPAGVAVVGVCPTEARVVCDATTATIEGFIIDGDGATVENLGIDGCKNGVHLPRDSGHSARLAGLIIEDSHGTGLRLRSGTVNVERVVIRDGFASPDGGSGWGIGLNYGANVTFRDVAVERAVGFGIIVSGTESVATFDDVVVRDMRPEADGTRGDCAAVNFGASLSMRGAFIDGCSGTGIYARMDASLTLEDFVIERVGLSSSGTEGSAIEVYEGARMTARRGLVGDPARGGVRAWGASTTAIIEDLVVDATGARSDDIPGWGIVVSEGASVTASRIGLRDIDGYGLSVLGGDLFPDTTLEVEDVSAFRMHADVAAGELAAALVANGPARLVARRVSVVGAEVYGLSSALTTTTLEDVSVDDITMDGRTDIGACGICTGGADVQVSRTRISRVNGLCLSARGPGGGLDASDIDIAGCTETGPNTAAGVVVNDTPATLERVRIADAELISLVTVGPSATIDASDLLIRSNGSGRGIEVANDSSLRRVHIEDVAFSGFSIGGGVVSVAGLIIDGVTHPDPARSAIGLLASGRSSVFLDELEISDVTGLALAAQTMGTEVMASNLLVRRTADTSCADCLATGIGVGAFSGAHVSLTDFVVTQSALAGVSVADGEADLTRGEVSYAPIGANVASEGFDIGRLMNEVVYHSNGTNLDTETLPVPDPDAPTVVEQPDTVPTD